MPAYGNPGRRFVRREAVQLAAGARAGPGLVGYLGQTSALTVLNNGDSLPGGWNAHWDTGALLIYADNVVVDHYKINGCVIFNGLNPTISNCVVTANPPDFFVIEHSGTGKGYLTATDCTAIGQSVSGGNTQGNGIASDSGLIAIRCDVSRSGDGIHFVAQPGTPSKVSQCYVHHLALEDLSQHQDGMQQFQHDTAAGFWIVEHSYIARSQVGLQAGVESLNSALTAGPPSDDGHPVATGTVNNNFFEAGGYHLRIGHLHTNCVVTNNDFGGLAPDEFGEVAVDQPASIATWSNNRKFDGTLIPQP